MAHTCRDSNAPSTDHSTPPEIVSELIKNKDFPIEFSFRLARSAHLGFYLPLSLLPNATCARLPTERNSLERTQQSTTEYVNARQRLDRIGDDMRSSFPCSTSICGRIGDHRQTQNAPPAPDPSHGSERKSSPTRPSKKMLKKTQEEEFFYEALEEDL